MSWQPTNPDIETPETAGESPGDPKSVATRKVLVNEQGDPYAPRLSAYQKLRNAVQSGLNRIPHGERLMIGLTAIIALSTVGQIVISCNNNQATGRQVEKIIIAANRMDDAADRFSTSSSHIGQGMDNAVDHLAAQAEAAHDSLVEVTKNDERQAKDSQSSRLDAKAESDANTKRAADSLRETVEAFHRQDRAWVGIADAKPVDSQWNGGNLSMTVAFKLMNYGGSAAEHINFIAVLESDPSVYSYSCTELSKVHGQDILLPKQDHTINWVMNLTHDQMVKGWQHQNPVLGDDLFLTIFGCLEYSDKVGEPNHQTPFSYLVLYPGTIKPSIVIDPDKMGLENRGSYLHETR